MNKAQGFRAKAKEIVENSKTVRQEAANILTKMTEKEINGVYERKTKQLNVPIGGKELQKAHILARKYNMSTAQFVRMLLSSTIEAHEMDAVMKGDIDTLVELGACDLEG